MEVLGAPSGIATFRPRYCRCFIIRSRCLSAPSPPSSFRVQIQFHPWSKQLFRIIPKAQSAPDELFPDESNDDVPPADGLPREAGRKKEAIERLNRQLLEGVKPPYVEYLMGLGFGHDDIRRIVRRYHYIQYRSVDEQIRPFVEALQNVGVDDKGLLDILCRCPQAIGVSIEKKFMPTMEYLERLGIDKSQRVKALCRCPQIITLNMEKIEEKVAYFLELGVSAENVPKMIASFPQLFQLAVEKKLRPTTEFFLKKGFTKVELQTMIVRFPHIYGYSLTKSVIPKLQFFLEMDYPTSDLVIFPQYFGYSLEGRIKPRHKLAMEYGVRPPLTSLLCSFDRNYEMLLEKMVSRRNVKGDDKCSS